MIVMIFHPSSYESRLDNLIYEAIKWTSWNFVCRNLAKSMCKDPIAETTPNIEGQLFYAFLFKFVYACIILFESYNIEHSLEAHDFSTFRISNLFFWNNRISNLWLRKYLQFWSKTNGKQDHLDCWLRCQRWHQGHLITRIHDKIYLQA